jgi:hypothetical protein
MHRARAIRCCESLAAHRVLAVQHSAEFMSDRRCREGLAMSEQNTEKGRVSRRGFLQTSAGVATGVAVTAAPAMAAMALPGAAAAAPAVATDPSTPAPAEPITAYLRDASSSEVTVMAGTTETTYRDPVLAKRLLDAARQSNTEGSI